MTSGKIYAKFSNLININILIKISVSIHTYIKKIILITGTNS